MQPPFPVVSFGLTDELDKLKWHSHFSYPPEFVSKRTAKGGLIFLSCRWTVDLYSPVYLRSLFYFLHEFEIFTAEIRVLISMQSFCFTLLLCHWHLHLPLLAQCHRRLRLRPMLAK